MGKGCFVRMEYKRIQHEVQSKKDEIISFLIDLCKIPSVNPAFRGEGEYEKALWLRDVLESHGYEVNVVEVPDSSVKEGKRLNLITVIPGRDRNRTLWVFGHLDTVAPGNLDLWETDPMVPTIKEGKIYGRGTEDNGQAIANMVYSAIILKEMGLTPSQNVGLVFVSDEEAGSEKGLKYLVANNWFKEGDEALVPDAGVSDGSFIEVAEKSILWTKFTIVGKETHASWPHQGINAGWVGNLMAVDLIRTMRKKYCDHNKLFEPPYSTFELTQKFSNVDSPNIVPGRDIFVTDFRVLPEWKLSEIIDDIDRLVSKYEYEHKVKISYEFLQRVDAPEPTDPQSTIVKKLKKALKERAIDAKVGGIGGGTCAAALREIGIPAVVWCTVDETAHQPNEYTVIENLINDTATMLAMMLED